MWFFKLFPFAIVNFEKQNNIVFTTIFFVFSQKICTAVHNCYACLAIQTELKDQKLQRGSLGIFCKYNVNTKRKISPKFQGAMS